jgi:hypothetical protein
MKTHSHKSQVSNLKSQIRSRRNSAPASRRPFLERLEERTVMASFISGFGGTGAEYLAPSHGLDPEGNSYISGNFRSPVADFDPSANAFNLVNAGDADAFIAKYAADGSLAWARSIGSSGSDLGQGAMFVRESGGDFVYWRGLFSGTVDFGDGSGPRTSLDQWDAFLTKLDATTGETVWVRNIGVTGGVGGEADIAVTDGKIYTTGGFTGSMDFDPGPGVANLTSGSTYSGFLWTLDSNGEYVGAWQLSGAEIFSVVAESDTAYVRGRFTGTVDFDPGTAVQNASSIGDRNIFVASYSVAGQSPSNPTPTLEWLQSLSSRGISTGTMAADATALYVASSVDPVPGGGDALVASFSKSDGSVRWTKQYGNPGGIFLATPIPTASGSVFLAGRFSAANFDFNPSGPGGEVTNAGAEGTSDAIVLKLDSATGAYQKVWSWGGTGNDRALSHGVLGTSIYVASRFEGSMSLPFGSVTSHGSDDGYVMAFDENVVFPPPAPSTKFYVADDGTTDKTFEYAANGTAIENYNVASANSAPRGAASTAAGDKVWVVDANKNVYVYNTSGGVLGSWSAGSLPNNANVQGITVSGSDVWIVDAQGDKVYRYSGAATRLSGSQNAASSFNLNNSNKDATDLVTDGTSIWVLNNTSTDKVFKYTVSGSLQGSWTISGGGGSPTGITIDPSSVSNIWIVDSSTDRIYEFNAATSRTSGSQAPASSFPLSSTNTNPQGLADPPAPTLTRRVSEGLSLGATAGSSSSASAVSHDSALLAITDELSSLFAPKKRK